MQNTLLRSLWGIYLKSHFSKNNVVIAKNALLPILKTSRKQTWFWRCVTKSLVELLMLSTLHIKAIDGDVIDWPNLDFSTAIFDIEYLNVTLRKKTDLLIENPRNLRFLLLESEGAYFWGRSKVLVESEIAGKLDGTSKFPPEDISPRLSKPPKTFPHLMISIIGWL